MRGIKYSVLFISGILFLWACQAPQHAVQPRSSDPLESYRYFLIDSILQRGLDHEALYTLAANIKPMSSLVTFSFPFANTDTTSSLRDDIVDRNEKEAALDRLYDIQQAVFLLDRYRI